VGLIWDVDLVSLNGPNPASKGAPLWVALIIRAIKTYTKDWAKAQGSHKPAEAQSLSPALAEYAGMIGEWHPRIRRLRSPNLRSLTAHPILEICIMLRPADLTYHLTGSHPKPSKVRKVRPSRWQVEFLALSIATECGPRRKPKVRVVFIAILFMG